MKEKVELVKKIIGIRPELKKKQSKLWRCNREKLISLLKREQEKIKEIHIGDKIINEEHESFDRIVQSLFEIKIDKYETTENGLIVYFSESVN